jgi:hypothetical protein
MPSSTWVSPFLKSYPRLARLGQSLRRYKDGSGEPYLQLIDAAKFALAILQVFVYYHWCAAQALSSFKRDAA